VIAEHLSQSGELSTAKQLLLERLRNGQLPKAAIVEQSGPVRRGASISPMSYGQEQIWLSTQLCPAAPMYNECVTVGHHGPLDVLALQWSFNEVLRRHDAWRTTFEVRDGQPVQIVHEPLWRELPVVDLTGLPVEERKAQALRFATEDARRSIDAEHGPLIRAQLALLSDDDQRLFLTMHHITFDGVALYNVFLPELVQLYEAHQGGHADPLPEPALQYPDYAAWQREALTPDSLGKNLAFWRSQLDGVPAELSLPTDRPRQPLRSFRGALERVDLSPELSRDLQALSRREGVTLFVTLLSAFAVLLQRYSGQADFVVGTVTAGRNRSELRRLLGYFLNVIPLRLDASPELTVRELLAKTREITLDAYSHDEAPFEILLRELKVERSPGRSPLFQVMFTLEPPISPVSEEWSLSQLDVDTGTAKFDLSVELDERPDGIIGRFEYNTDLFDRATIRQMMAHWSRILEEIVRDPNQTAGRLPMLSEQELRRQVVEWNATAIPYPAETPAHELFEAQADAQPEAPALIAPGRAMGYGELNRRANQLARHLGRLGVGPSTRVGICLERTPEFVASALAVLKAGAAFIPLDPSYPAQRLDFMIRDSDAVAIVAAPGNAAKLAAAECPVVFVEPGWEAFTHESPANLGLAVGGRDVAYVMYTSGSTGSPKGVEVCHRGIARLLFGTDFAQLDSSSTFLATAPASFDVSMFDLWGPLLRGGRCVLTDERVPSPAAIRDAIRDHGVNTMWLTASLFNSIVDEAPDALRGLRELVIGGEALSVPHVERALRLLPAVQLVNGYGPTEATTFACCHRIPKDMPPGARSIPIGQPIGNTRAYVLDALGQPVPLGVAGELHIGGPGVARGYLNRPKLTQERFIPDPFGDEPDARLYRTGDLARYRPDGAIEFLGRADGQVKVRGFRIELGEIEAALSGLAAIREAVVVVREDQPGQKRLAGYVVPATPIDASDLRQALQDRLPGYMVPSDFVFLEELPIGPTGKLDRGKLPAPAQVGAARVPGTREPRDEIEATLVRLFQDLLSTSAVGVEDNFFVLGGDSLLAVRLLARVSNATGVDIPLSRLWEDATVAYLASLVRREQPASISSSPLLRLRQGTKRPFFCAAPLDGNGFRFTELAQRLEEDRPFVAFRANWWDGKDRQPAGIREVAAHYVDHLRTAQPEGPYLLGGHSFGGAVAFEMAQLLTAQGQPVGLLAMLDCGPSHWAVSPGWSRRALANILRNLPGWVGEAATRGVGEWRDSLRQELSFLQGDTREQPGLDELWQMDELPASYRDFLRRQYDALIDYRPKPYPGRLTLFRARSRSLLRPHDRDLGWQPLVAGGIDTHSVPGTHLTALREPHVGTLAEQLSSCLQHVDPR